MKIKFWKMHGTQNDFVLCDDRNKTFPSMDQKFIAHLATRHSGIGAEGVILIQPSKTADFSTRFFNPDGGEVNMCGNGARCAAQLAFELGAANETMIIETAAGLVPAQVLHDGICLWMTDPSEWTLNESLDFDDRQQSYSFVNTGVPHIVIRVSDLSEIDVVSVGSTVRHHRLFAPDGANVNFLELSPTGDLNVRTYERGVEAETASCGTGVTACGLIAAKNGWVSLPAPIRVASGDVLTVNGQLTEDGAREVTLMGPTAHVFHGTITYSHPTLKSGFKN